MTEPKEIPDRVSITYSVDLVDVPGRVKLMMNELAHSLGDVARACREAGDEVVQDPLDGTQSLAEANQLIKKTSTRVEDCIEIMVGYINIFQPPVDEEE